MLQVFLLVNEDGLAYLTDVVTAARRATNHIELISASRTRTRSRTHGLITSNIYRIPRKGIVSNFVR